MAWDKAVAGAKQLTIWIGLAASIYFVWMALGSVKELTTDVRSAAGTVDAAKLRLLLSSTALYIAVAFAALGFGLFLIGAQGSFKVTDSKNSVVPAFETSAPGLVVMVCATVVVYLALNVGVQTSEKHSAPATDPKAAVATHPPPAPDFGLLDGGHK